MLDPSLTSSRSFLQSPFCAVRPKRVFGYGAHRVVENVDRHLIRDCLEAFRAARLVPPNALNVVNALFHFQNSRSGLCFPSHQALARRALVGVRTVQRVLDLLKRFGLLSWEQRQEHRRNSDGVRISVQSSNSYLFHVPASVEAALAAAQRVGRLVRRVASGLARALEAAGSRLPFHGKDHWRPASFFEDAPRRPLVPRSIIPLPCAAVSAGAAPAPASPAQLASDASRLMLLLSSRRIS